MGIRFSKRIRVCKGLSINLSKSGCSLSVGGRGATTNFSRRGLRTTLSIPGTGIRFQPSSASVRRAEKALAREQQLAAKRIAVAHNTHKTLQIQQEFERTVGELINFWRGQVPFFNRSDYDAAAMLRPFVSQLRAPKKYDRQKVAGPVPVEPTKRSTSQLLRTEIESKILEAEPIPILMIVLVLAFAFVFSLPVFLLVRWLIFSFPMFIVSMMFWSGLGYLSFRFLWLDDRRPDIEKHIETNLENRLSEEQASFDNAMASYQIESKKRLDLAEKEYQQGLREYDQSLNRERDDWNEAELERTKWARGVLSGDPEIVSEAILASFSDLMLPFDSDLDAYVSENGSIACLNLDLPELEDVTEYSALGFNSDGTAKYTKRDSKQRYTEYSQLTSGFIVLVVATAFSAAPTLKKVIVGAYTQRGQNGKDTYVLQFEMTRDQNPNPETVNNMDPCQFLGHYGVKVRVSNTGRLNPIPKPNWDELLTA